jgi:peptidyl-prolyl cis-trans isomerase B (cyclophilin B)
VARFGLRAAFLALLACWVPARAGANTEEVAVLLAPQGEIVWRFLPREAPEHVRYFKRLIESGFYDGTTFHRVIPHFVVQGGDPNSRNEDRADDGDGSADRRLKAEFSTRLHYRPGTVGMARDADPDSGSCQFFIALENIPRLDGRYTIFGELVSGIEVARRIASLPRDLNDNPLQPVKVTIRLEKRPIDDRVYSLEVGRTGSGEVLTGPGKPRPYDPKNRLFKAPSLSSAPAPAGSTPSGPGSARARLDMSIGEDGRVIDVRFKDARTQDADRLAALATSWRFAPASYDGKPQKARFEIDADGTGIGPPTGGGAPIDLEEAMAATSGSPTLALPPRPALRVTLSAGAKRPSQPARIRLTVDAAGAVTDAALQSSCGDAALDAAALEAARRLSLDPAMRLVPGKKDPEPAAAYLDLTATFVLPDS